jgi:hypothetical protein
LSPTWSRVAVSIAFCACSAAAIANGYYRLHELNAEAFGLYAPYLASYGLAPQFMVYYFILSESLVAAAFAVMGLVIAWRGATNGMTVFSAIALMAYGVTIPPPMHALVVSVPALPPALRLERSVGIALFVIFLCIFPEGRFRSWMSRSLALLVLGWALVWPFVPMLNPYAFAKPWPFVALAALLGSGITVQLYRYSRSRTPLQRQQTKWVVYGVTTSVVGDLIFHLPWVVLRLQHGPDLLVLLIHQPFFIASQLAVPISIGFSVMYYRLWEIDLVVSRTLIYGLVMSAAAVLWEAINLTAQKMIQTAMGPAAATFSTGIATVATGLVLKPMYEKIKTTIDQKLRPEDIDLTNDFPEFTAEFRARVPLATLLDVLANHTRRVFNVADAAVYLYDERGNLRPVETSGMTMEEASLRQPDAGVVAKLSAGKPVALGSADHAELAVALMLPRTKFPDVLGILLLGERHNERGYSAQDLTALEGLGKQAGTTIYFARLPT